MLKIRVWAIRVTVLWKDRCWFHQKSRPDSTTRLSCLALSRHLMEQGSSLVPCIPHSWFLGVAHTSFRSPSLPTSKGEAERLSRDPHLSRGYSAEAEIWRQTVLPPDLDLVTSSCRTSYLTLEGFEFLICKVEMILARVVLSIKGDYLCNEFGTLLAGKSSICF